MIKTTEETLMEDRLIKQVTEDVSQWNFREDLTTEAALWDNLRQILSRNNKAILGEVPLTDQEFQQIKNQLTFASPYAAGEWLAGENGVAKVEVQREDASLGKIRLTVFNTLNVAGGSSVYEVIRQFRTESKMGTGESARFDVTFLINGLPLIHLELKQANRSYLRAFDQIKNYDRAGYFKGIYSLVQMFVVTNGVETRYIPAASHLDLKADFLIRWVDEDNQPVDHYLDFARAVLRIPMAHRMVTDYAVLDSDRKAVILLRPYQIHAIEGVKAFARERKSGYVWHTTGSGKTLTSYKVSKNLLAIPSLDKTIFIVDRKDLDQQTTSSFTSYAALDTIDIDGTDSVKTLEASLASKDRTVLITTIQKIHYLMKKAERNPEKKLYQTIRNKKLAFVVDECHRAVSPLKQHEINGFFKEPALWYGFTGTPIFAETKKASVGDLPQTTQEQYGDRIHQYTVMEAIKDGAVLGFQMEYASTIGEDAREEILRKVYPNKNLSLLTESEKVALIPDAYFEDENHMLAVVDRILNKSAQKFGLDRKEAPYSAILTTSSIAKAQTYYELFQEVLRGERPEVQLSESIKRKQADFSKIAITYSIAGSDSRYQNDEIEGTVNESLEASKEKMAQSLEDYNAMFGTHFNLGTLGSYNNDVTQRLARKKSKYQVRAEQLDLVIVVDRLLTGFDAPSLRILFMDRKPMSPHGLIQAFSRTNRIFDAQKGYGQIVTLQRPWLYKEKVDEALVLYSNGGENYVTAPTYEEAYADFKDACDRLLGIAPTPESVNDLTDVADKKEFLAAFQAFDKAYTAVRVYSEFEENGEEEALEKRGLGPDQLEAYLGRYKTTIETIGPGPDPELGDELIDIDYDLQSVHQVRVDFDYILRLIQSYADTYTGPTTEEEATDKEQASKAQQEIIDHLADYEKTNPMAGKIVRDLWEDFVDNPGAYQYAPIANIIEEAFQKTSQEKVQAFSYDWQVPASTLQYVADHFVDDETRTQVGEKELLGQGQVDKYNAIHDESISKIQYRKKLRRSYKDFILKEIMPLKRR